MDRAVARRWDPQTSWEAARSVKGIGASQRRVLALLLEYGPSDDVEIMERHRDRFPGVLATSSGLRTRRSELCSMGLVLDTGRTRVLQSGRRSIVWRARDDAPPDLGGLFDERLDPDEISADGDPGWTGEPVYRELPDDHDGMPVVGSPGDHGTI